VNEAEAKKVVIANPDDERQITPVLVATMTGEYLPVQLIYKGKTIRCLPKYHFQMAGMFGTQTIIDQMRTLWRDAYSISLSHTFFRKGKMLNYNHATHLWYRLL